MDTIISSLPSIPSAELQALRQAAQLAQQRQQAEAVLTPKSSLWKERAEAVGHYAEPLSPLRDRDLKALADWFQRDDILQIETDISRILLCLLPEPCWEDNWFDFLHDFL
jgi:hypothetical protein